MTDNQICATYYAALVHDFEHLGVNNDYLIKSFHPLAVMYNDISPLENHHVAAAVRVMLRPECMFCSVSPASPLPVTIFVFPLMFSAFYLLFPFPFLSFSMLLFPGLLMCLSNMRLPLGSGGYWLE